MSDLNSLRSQTVDAWSSEVPELDQTTMEAVALIKSISTAIDRTSERACVDQTISAAELELLVPLRHHRGPMTASRLADRLNMSRAGVSKHLRRLEARGIVERRGSESDRRTTDVRVTELGKVTTDSAFARDLEMHQFLLRECLENDTTIATLQSINQSVLSKLEDLK